MIPPSFTPQQMREMADKMDPTYLQPAIDMLRFAADALDQPQPETVQALIAKLNEKARSCQIAANTTGLRGSELIAVRDALADAARLLSSLPQRGWQQENERLREALNDALIITRNYYAQAISRAKLEEHQQKWIAALKRELVDTEPKA